jgi:hypothetical protein
MIVVGRKNKKEGSEVNMSNSGSSSTLYGASH